MATGRPLAAITGASSGIGYELAKVFAKNGYDLLICAENEEIFSAKTQIETFGSQIDAFQIDLANFDGVEEFFQKIDDKGRPLDVLVLNAGVGVGGGEFAHDTSLLAELNLINLNVVSTVHLCKKVLQRMHEVGKGKILFTSSIAAVMPGPFEAVYAASKAFVQSFATAIRNELHDHTDITITCLMPGPTETNFFERAGMQETPVGVSEKDDAAEVAEEGFRALMEGKDHVIAGSLTNKLFGAASKVLPDTATASLHRRQTEPFSHPKH